jgi:hypothetical protein
MSYSDAAKKLAIANRQKKKAAEQVPSPRQAPAKPAAQSQAAATPAASQGKGRVGQDNEAMVVDPAIEKASVETQTDEVTEGTPTAQLQTYGDQFRALLEAMQPLVLITSWLMTNMPVEPRLTEQRQAAQTQLQMIARAVGVP